MKSGSDKSGKRDMAEFCELVKDKESQQMPAHFHH